MSRRVRTMAGITLAECSACPIGGARTEHITVIWIVAFVIGGVAVSIGFGYAITWVRDRHIRLMLGIPDAVNGDVHVLRAKLAAQSVADTEMQINAAAPNLNPEHRRRLALALTRQKGLLPRKVA
jgi:hypothetical protein